MEGAILLLAVLACPVGMGLMMWIMGKNMKSRDDGAGPSPPIDELRAERERLAREIERLEKGERPHQGELATR